MYSITKTSNRQKYFTGIFKILYECMCLKTIASNRFSLVKVCYNLPRGFLVQQTKITKLNLKSLLRNLTEIIRIFLSARILVAALLRLLRLRYELLQHAELAGGGGTHPATRPAHTTHAQ